MNPNREKCTITGNPVTKVGSREKMMRGEVDAMSTNIGLVCRAALDEYDEAVKRAR